MVQRGAQQMAAKKLLARDEVLGGLGGRATKQAHTLLALIENRTAHLVAHSRQAANTVAAVAAAPSAQQSFLTALAEGRARLPRPTIQEIERYAPQWAILAPATPTIRAILVHLLGENYTVPAHSSAAIQAALGVQTPAVQQAYQQLYQRPISTVFAPRVPWWEGVQWRWVAFSQRLEGLPPFWLTFFLTLPAVSGLLALPIALAEVGAFWGVMIILTLGLINLVTVAALAETVVRSGAARYGLGFLGQLTQEYLGSAATSLMTLALVVSNFLVLIIFFLGVGDTLAAATGLPASLWMVLLLGITLYFLSRRSLNATVTTSLLIVFANLLIVMAILLLALPYFHWGNLGVGAGAVNSGVVSSGGAFTPAALGSIVGILSATFLSHYLVLTYGPVILPRDPGGRAWLRGSVAAVVTMMVIAVLWLLVNVGVLGPAILREAKGTVVTPLAALVGPTVNVLGSLLVILSIGLATVQVSLAQYYSVEEWLPAPGSATWIGRLPTGSRFWLAVSPMFLVLALAIWLLVSGVGSFASLLGTVNVLALPLITGIIPLLLLVATRHMGDFVPTASWRWLGNRLLIGLLILFFVATIVFHGLYIWTAWPLRVIGVGGGLIILLVALWAWRQSTSRGRVVMELRHDERRFGASGCHLAAAGQPLATTIMLDHGAHQTVVQGAMTTIADFATLHRVTVDLPPTPARTLKLWLHQLPVAGGSVGLPVLVKLWCDGQPVELPGVTRNGQLLAPWSGGSGRIEVMIDHAAQGDSVQP